MIKPITGRQSHLSSINSINSILLVDRASNINRIKSLLNDLDINNSAKISIIKLNNLPSIEAVRILEKLKAQNNPTINKFVSVPFAPSNSIIISANDFVTENIKKTLSSLDADIINSDETIEVVYLKYAKSNEVASILNSISGRFMSNSDGKSTVITSHEKTNSIVISSDQSNISTLKNLISKLDIRRAQVLVEAVIVELSENAANDLGVETVFSGGSENGEIPIGITRFNDSGPDLLSIVGGAADDTNTALTTNSLTSLLNTQGIVAGFGDLSAGGDSFAAIINAISRDVNSNILSTPSLLAMDNETASYIIGQEIPITTGESLGSNNANPFRTTSRQEVGIKLDITPQINEGSSVLLEIKIEVSGVAGTVSSGVDLITNKRAIETTALADDGQTIVLGGLIDDDTQETISKVPLLGSIPVFGKLFQSKSKTNIKKNLMIFIRPRIMTDSNSVYDVSSEKYNYIKAQQVLSNEEKLLEEISKSD